MNKILIIIGPTASGKTALGVRLAKEKNGEIISADSRQVYKGMDIATGKDLKEYDGVPVWGLDLVNPDYNFNVSDFVKYATEKILDIQSRGKVAIIVGGTALYIKALIEPFETLNVPKNETLRSELEKLSIPELQARLGKTSLNESDVNNPRRLVRAIEVKESEPVSLGVPKFEYQIISLVAPLDLLYDRIDKRVDKRYEQGVEEELARLLKTYSFDLPSMTALGYKDIKNPKAWKLHEHQYAKRQITFIKKFLADKEVLELDIAHEEQKGPLSI